MKDYSKIAKPHSDLLDTFKEALTTTPILAYPDFKKQIKLHTDVSGAGLGAVLPQEFHRKEHIITYAS